MILSNYDCIVIGAGFSGAIVAERLASIGRRVLVIESRSHLGGNSYDYFDIYGNLISRYGCHIFHTNNEEVMSYLEKFSKFYDYRHKVTAELSCGNVPIPININSLIMMGHNPELLESDSGKLYLKDLMDSDNDEIQKIGEDLYEHIYSKYTMKQWGIPLEQVDRSTINRIPIYLDKNDEHFRDKYQKLPVGGYTNLITHILNHENIDVHTNVDIKDLISFSDTEILDKEGNTINIPIVYTGTLDYLFDYRYGELPFRSLEFRGYLSNLRLPTCAVNASDSLSTPYTRSIDYSYLQENPTDNIFIVEEYPHSYERGKKNSYTMYPIRNEHTIELHMEYAELANRYDNLFFLGGQATYKDLDMTTTIEGALKFFSLFKEVLDHE